MSSVPVAVPGAAAPVIAAIVPCFNEEVTIAKVVDDLTRAVPGLVVFVYDNDSTDGTAAAAAGAGAVVRRESVRGKGNVVRRAFADVDADVYVLIDGDDTYDADALPEMLRVFREGPYDHVLGVRRETSSTAYRPGHALGNRLFNRLVGSIFEARVSDMLSGYRVMSRRLVKSFPALAREFETETELTVHVMSLRVPSAEVAVGFRDRPAGSASKLRTFRDGARILGLITHLVRHERPLLFYGVIGALLALVALVAGLPLVVEYAETGMVSRMPTAVIVIGVGLAAVLSGVIGLVLDGVLKLRRELSRLTYLRHDAPA